ncbi:hypothetical protein CUR178_03249 [Leishmania enriettii]|uniref:Uncharacterized protein n=1 Tax=Leishmania enriettii TaxID=5663 RepID=A0A836KEJ0_LEIEN|nr:hypothetical protein CUR178_03249 [Leishmania enriettii]
MQSTMTSSAAVSTEPLFATVTFVGEDNVQGNTFRVPISPATTVRRLAKDAMQRLVMSRRNLGGCSEAPAIVVTEVYVGGTGAQPKAEVFAQDCVTQVVVVKEEVVFMRFKAMSTSATLSRLDSPPPPPQQASGPSATSCTTAACSDRAAPPTASAAAQVALKETTPSKDGTEPAVEVKCSAPPAAAAEAKPTAKHATTQKLKCDGAATAAAPAETEPLAPNRRLGWGPEAYGLFPENYTSTPGKRPRTVRSGKTVAAAQAEKRSRTDLCTAAVPRANVKGVEEPSGKRTLADRRPGWGPEASKHFPDNYVSSPEKLARLQRVQRQCVNASAKSTVATLVAAATRPALKTSVSRTLQYPTAETEEGRTTVGHAVDDPIVVGEMSPRTELPKGWGRESLKFFDPNTYCDDPAKARLLPNMDYSRSRRHRRPAPL